MNYNELNNAIRKIDTWYDKKIKVLSIKTRPFNVSNIFIDIINKILNKNGKVLYVFCSDEDINYKKEEVIISIKEEIEYKNLKVIFIKEIDSESEEYDLVIFNDISLFSKVNNDNLRDYIESIYWSSKRIIIYSSEFVFPIGEKIDLRYILSELPIVEPRLMSTRIKLEEDIPLALFEYFKWFKKNKKIVIIVVPSEDKLNKVYNHYYKVLRALNIRVEKYKRNQNFNDIKQIMDGYSDSLFIITNCCGEYMKNISNANIILLFADDLYYSYKKIIFICGCLDNNLKHQSELIMVSKDITEDMDKARDITRGFNKVLWEK